jgi:hypothetical protein
MGVIGFNLRNLFLNSEDCKTFNEFSLKSLRQKRIEEENPKVIVYTDKTFAVIHLLEFLPLILDLKVQVQKNYLSSSKISLSAQRLFRNASQISK